MNIEQRRMAANSMQSYGEHYGDFFVELSAELNGALAGSASTTSPSEAIANRHLISELVALLPTEKISDYVPDIIARSPAELRLLQANSVWIKNLSYDYPVSGKKSPHYLVGQKAVSANKLSLLVHSPSGATENGQTDGRTFHELQVSRRAFTNARKEAESLATQPLTENEISEAKTENGFSLKPGLSRVPMKLIIPACGSNGNLAARTFYAPLRMGHLGRYMYAATRNVNIQAISDEKLGEFEVFKHLGHLLNVFGVLNEGIELTKGANKHLQSGDLQP